MFYISTYDLSTYKYKNENLFDEIDWFIYKIKIALNFYLEITSSDWNEPFECWPCQCHFQRQYLKTAEWQYQVKKCTVSNQSGLKYIQNNDEVWLKKEYFS